MDRLIKHGERTGSVVIPSSKSYAHRLLICSALGGEKTEIICRGFSDDILATVDCLRALGADIEITGDRIAVRPIKGIQKTTYDLYCRESGSTLRFLIPVVGALGADAVFHMEGRLPERPVEPLAGILRSHGMTVEPKGELLHVSGKLEPGSFEVPGNVSSQYITGLLMALPVLSSKSEITVTGKVESEGYIRMTQDVLRAGRVDVERKENRFLISGESRYAFDSVLLAEGDWSNAAFFLCAGAFSEKGISVYGLNPNSAQGDSKIVDILQRFGAEVKTEKDSVTVKKHSLSGIDIDASMIPDLVPVLSVVASVADGETRIYNAARLRLKESDRLRSTSALISSLGGAITETEDSLIVHGVRKLSGGKADSFSDHRIAMSAAVAACVCENDVTISGSECVKKSYPGFYEDFGKLNEG